MLVTLIQCVLALEVAATVFELGLLSFSVRG